MKFHHDLKTSTNKNYYPGNTHALFRCMKCKGVYPFRLDGFIGYRDSDLDRGWYSAFDFNISNSHCNISDEEHRFRELLR